MGKRDFHEIQVRFGRILHIVTHPYLHFVSETDVCATNPCKNGGMCYTDYGGYFSCTCRVGFSGFDCDLGKVSGV